MNENYDIARQTLAQELKAKGVRHAAVLNAIAAVPRHLFVPEAYLSHAYEDVALPLTCQQTISQPYVVARMTEAIMGEEKPRKVLEIGTGSGYQAAVLARLVDEVYSVERIKSLYDQAKARFKSLGLDSVHLRHGDGYQGWAEHAPFDAILVTAGATYVPPALLEQLADEGRMIIPVGSTYGSQTLQLITRRGQAYETDYLDPVLFVPVLPGQIDE